MSPRKSKLGRRPRDDRDAVRSELVTLKLTPPEGKLLDRLIAVREAEVSAASGGGRVVLSRSSVLRELLTAECARRNLTEG